MVTETLKTVLMADDDEEDCMLAAEAFAKTGSNAEFSCVEDGFALMEYLSGFPACHAGKQCPDLILLDLNMPRKDGRKALCEIQSDPVLRQIPVVILTTSREERDISLSDKTGAKSFITKPASFDEWVDIMKSLAESWLS